MSGNLAREVARLTAWTDKIWARRYTSLPVSEEETAQVARLIYILSHGVKEHLVERVEDWPGSIAPVHSGAASLSKGPGSTGPWNSTLDCGAKTSSPESMPPRSLSSQRVAHESGTAHLPHNQAVPVRNRSAGPPLKAKECPLAP
jgi:hypothetical protein